MGIGAGDLNIKAECNLLIQIYELEDCLYFNDETSTNGITIGSGVSCTVENNSYLKITKSTSGEAYITYPTELNNSDNFVIEWELAKLGTSQHIACWLNSPTTATGLWVYYDTHFGGALTNSQINKSTTFVVGDKLRIIQQNGVISIYKNDDVQIFSKTTSFSATNYKCGNYTNNGRVQYVKNIKIKRL